MDFKEWLTENQMGFGLFANDGTVVAYVNGQRYVYHTDPVYHEKWKQLARFKPFSVLNDIKKHIKLGKAELISPKPMQKPVQQTLF